MLSFILGKNSLGWFSLGLLGGGNGTTRLLLRRLRLPGNNLRLVVRSRDFTSLTIDEDSIIVKAGNLVRVVVKYTWNSPVGIHERTCGNSWGRHAVTCPLGSSGCSDAYCSAVLVKSRDRRL